MRDNCIWSEIFRKSPFRISIADDLLPRENSSTICPVSRWNLLWIMRSSTYPGWVWSTLASSRYIQAPNSQEFEAETVFASSTSWFVPSIIPLSLAIQCAWSSRALFISRWVNGFSGSADFTESESWARNGNGTFFRSNAPTSIFNISLNILFSSWFYYRKDRTKMMIRTFRKKQNSFVIIPTSLRPICFPSLWWWFSVRLSVPWWWTYSHRRRWR